MIETKYICDKCGHTQLISEQMWLIRAAYRHSTSYYGNVDWSGEEKMWCRKCMESVGILPISPAPPKDVLPAPQTPFEDLLRELIANVVQERTGA